MVKCKIYKGIEYVQLDELPLEQQQKVKETLSHHIFIKILVDGVIIDNCIQYKDYAYWHKNVFKASITHMPKNKDLEAA